MAEIHVLHSRTTALAGARVIARHGLSEPDLLWGTPGSGLLLPGVYDDCSAGMHGRKVSRHMEKAVGEVV